MVTFTKLESIPEELFNSLFEQSLEYFSTESFSWSPLGLNVNSSLEEKRNAILQLFKSSAISENALVTLVEDDDEPLLLAMGEIDEDNCAVIQITLTGTMRSKFFDEEYLTILREKTVEYLSSVGCNPNVFKGVIYKDSGLKRMFELNPYITIISEETIGVLGFPEKELIKLTLSY